MRAAITLLLIAALCGSGAAQEQSPSDTVTITRNADGTFEVTPRPTAFQSWAKAVAVTDQRGNLQAVHLVPKESNWRAEPFARAAYMAGGKVEEISYEAFVDIFPGQGAIMEALSSMLTAARGAACSIDPRPSTFTTGTDLTVAAAIVEGTIRFEVTWTGDDLCG